MIYIAIEIVFVILLITFKKGYSNYKIAAIAGIFFYFSILIFAQIEGYIIEQKLNAYDLDGDGIFTSTEQTAGFDKAESAYISDTGRNFIFITGIPYAIIWFTIVYSLLWLTRRQKAAQMKIDNP